MSGWWEVMSMCDWVMMVELGWWLLLWFRNCGGEGSFNTFF